MGLQEAVFPRPGRPEPFFGDEERRELNSASGLRLRSHEDALGAERYLFYATASRPTDLLVLSWRAADDDGGPAVRSPFADDVADQLGAGLVTDPERRELGAAGWSGDLAPTAREAARAAAAAAPRVRPAQIVPLRLSGAVRGALAQRPTWSASAIETWTACPVRWFVERLLAPEPLVPDPEPMVRGALAHKVLERALAALVSQGARGLTPERLPEARQLVRDALDEHAADFKISVNPERLRSALRRLEVDLVRYLEHAAHAGSSFVPADFEVRFGAAEDPWPALELDGGALALEGRIDRVDRGAGGEAIIYDYKGRTATASARWVQDGKLQVALYMLAVRHVLGLEPAGGFYQPLGGEDNRARGALVDGADPGLNVVRTDRLAEEDLDALLADCARAAREAVEAMRAGALVPRPDTCGWSGEGCSHPTICRCMPT
jgi:ATP-dependent helicase/DNAse subunit B